MRTIAVINRQSGVGKTTIVANLGHALALRGNRVLLADLDPQGQLATFMGLFRTPREGMDQVLLEQEAPERFAVSTRELLEVVTAGERLAEVEQLAGGMERGLLLKKALEESIPDTDYLLLDCPSDAGLLMINAVLAADELLIPCLLDEDALTDVGALMSTIRRMAGMRERPLKFWAVVNRLTAKYVPKSAEARIDEQVGKLLKTPLREAPVLEECSRVGRTIFEYRHNSRPAKEFSSLCDDLMDRRAL